MKISTKGRYGLRAMLDLAIYSSNTHVSLNSIATRQDISLNYLEQVFSILRKSALIKSVKGAQGGYLLADSPANITIGRILRALEGDLSVIEDKDQKNISINTELILTENVWQKINQSINSVVDSITLEDIVSYYKDRFGKEDPIMYYI